MGDPRRFRLFADLIVDQFADLLQAPVADVAGGKGMLRAQLWLRGFADVTSWDVRHSNAKGRRGTRYGLFTKDAAEDYGLVAAMHPDEGTDHAVLYAAQRRVPFAVCPCCVKPSAAPFAHDGKGHKDKRRWVAHLCELAKGAGFKLELHVLPMHGDGLVVVGRPT